MSALNPLGQLSGLHQMIIGLAESTPETDLYRAFHPDMAPLAWYIGRAVYLETYWIREVVQEDDTLTARVRDIFSPHSESDPEMWRRLPPLDHLLNWALELQDDNLMRLANPHRLPEHPLCAQGRLTLRISQQLSQLYESMLMVLVMRQKRQPSPYRVEKLLQPLPPSGDLVGISQGHYRIGAKGDPSAFDNEQPPQVVELSSFRIDRYPVTNGAYLGFIESGGYEDEALWGEAGWRWLQGRDRGPALWARDDEGHWFGVGLNGAFDLLSEAPLTGISQFEASAYAHWVSGLGGVHAGAVLQHEYQWEVAARTQAISGIGEAWEWCSNLFHPYTGYEQPIPLEATTREFDGAHFSLRGASLHTQPALRRSSYRNRALPGADNLFAGTRLVFPPA